MLCVQVEEVSEVWGYGDLEGQQENFDMNIMSMNWEPEDFMANWGYVIDGRSLDNDPGNNVMDQLEFMAGFDQTEETEWDQTEEKL